MSAEYNLQGMTEDEAIDWFQNHLGGTPESWFDPIARAQMLGHSITSEVIEMHLNQFDQAYGDESRCGSRAKAVGDLRNIDGQGMPGESEWRNEVRERRNKY